MAKHIMTQAGLDKAIAELHEIKTVKRPAVIKRIKEARELGDLSENADYQDAREEQSFIEGRIQELEETIKDAQIVSASSGDVVGLGSRVTVSSALGQSEFEIVGPSESDPTEGKISNEAPLGMALMEHKTGDTVAVSTPDGEAKYEILKIE